MGAGRADIIKQLQNEILQLQGQKAGEAEASKQLGLGPIECAFPGEIFQRGAIHEFVSETPESAACANAFISVLSARLAGSSCCMWIGDRCTVFPPALKQFGLEPHRILFVNAAKHKDLLWIFEQALKCEALGTVVAEIPEISFNDSRRLQLAVERSRVTGFLHRYQPRTANALATVSRWQIRPLPSAVPEGMPGPGFPCWEIELQKVRNGRPGKWEVRYSAAGLEYLSSGNSGAQTYDYQTAG
jgi:protein ImuA